MTIESESLSNGVGKSERLGGKYRGARRETTVSEQVGSGISAGGPAETGSQMRPVSELDTPATTSLGGADLTELRLVGGTDRRSARSTVEFPELGESVTPMGGRPAPFGDRLIDHPLLRGLLLELPPRGAAPAAEWLDRWFEATRAILELFYAQPADSRR